MKSTDYNVLRFDAAKNKLVNITLGYGFESFDDAKAYADEEFAKTGLSTAVRADYYDVPDETGFPVMEGQEIVYTKLAEGINESVFSIDTDGIAVIPNDPVEADDIGDIDYIDMVEALEENEDQVECKVCFGLFPKAECKKLDVGYICPICGQELASHQGTNLDLVDADPTDLQYDDTRVTKFELEEPEIVEVTDGTDMRAHEAGIKPIAEDIGDKEYECIFDGVSIGTVMAQNEEEAYAQMEANYPEYPYGKYDGVAEVRLLDEAAKGAPQSKYDYDETRFWPEEAEYKGYKLKYADGGTYEVTDPKDNWQEYIGAGRYGIEDIQKTLDDVERSGKSLHDYFNKSLEEHVNEEHPPVESTQELKGTDNAVVDCQGPNKVVTHAEDEKPLDCKMKKAPLEKPLTEEYFKEAIEKEVDLDKKLKLYNDYIAFLNNKKAELEKSLLKVDNELIANDIKKDLEETEATLDKDLPEAIKDAVVEEPEAKEEEPKEEENETAEVSELPELPEEPKADAKESLNNSEALKDAEENSELATENKSENLTLNEEAEVDPFNAF